MNFRVLIYLLIFFLCCLPFIEGGSVANYCSCSTDHISREKVLNQVKTMYCSMVLQLYAWKKTITRKDNLKRHEEKCKVVFKCEECDFETLYNNSYKRHGKIRGNMFKQVHI